MAVNPGMMSSNSEEWETPQDFFDALDAVFQFELDAAASAQNAKCVRYWTKEDDALAQRWDGVVWCNPPYGRVIGEFVKKGYEEAQKGSVVVMLVPARTDTRWWHDWVMKAAEIKLVRGRLRFVGAPSSAPFPSAIVVFLEGYHTPILTTIGAKGKEAWQLF